MEPQGLSPLLSAYVYSLTHVCLMILFRVTPQSGWGLHAILLRPLSSPGPWAPGLLIHHFIEQQQTEIQSVMEENAYQMFLTSDIYLEYVRSGGENTAYMSMI